MAKLSFISIASALASFVASTAVPASQTYIYPNIADTSHATRHASKFFHNYFTAKSSDNGTAWADFFNKKHTSYYDTTLGATLATNWTHLATVLEGYAAQWAKTAPNDRAYPLRILGDTVGGAVVYFVDTAGLFGAELRIIAVFDFLDGTISRQVDSWDGRGNPVKNQSSTGPYPDLGLPGLQEKAAKQMQTVSRKLNAALSTGNVSAAAALFSYNAVFEDLTLRARIEGQVSITSYLGRAVAKLPYGVGAQVTHVVGSAVGGGYEWAPTGHTVRNGVNALELDDAGNITRFTAVWDGSRVSAATIRALAVLAPTP